MEITGWRQYEAATSGGIPPVELVGDGLWCIPVPFPSAALRYTLVYALVLHDGVALIDAGWRAESSRLALTEGLRAAGFAVSEVRAVLATHTHMDHYGLVEWVRACSDAWIGVHPAELPAITDRDDADALARRGTAAVRLRASTGMPAAGARQPMGPLIQSTRPGRLIEDGDRIPLTDWNLRAVWTPGHAPGHLSYFEVSRGLLFGGDHVLPRTRTNVEVTTYQRPDPVGDYQESLATISGLEVAEVLPAHEYRFADARGRLRALGERVESRLARIEEVLVAKPALTCWEITHSVTRRAPLDQLTAFQVRSVVGETHAFLRRLAHQGRARCEKGTPERWFAVDAAPHATIRAET